MKKYFGITVAAILLSSSLFANDELKFYTSQKYKADYLKLSKDQQKKIKDEYSKISNLSKKIDNKVKNDSDYKVLDNLTKINIWSNNFVKDYKPKDDELKKIYKENNFMSAPEYKLRTMSIANSEDVKIIEKKLNDLKNPQDKIKLFTKYVKEKSIDKTTKKNGGSLNWVSLASVQPNIRKALSKADKNKLLFINNKKFIQILLVEDIKKPKKLTFDEAKPSIINVAKKQALVNEIEKLSK